MKKISIKDIARKAGVCIGTVSRVINNLDRVHPATRRKIQKLISQTGYRPSSAGRALVSGRTHNILVVLHNIADPYCAALSKIFSQRWHSLGYKMLLGDSNHDVEMEREHLVRAREGSVDGLLISPIPGRSNKNAYLDMAKTGLPFVAIDNQISGLETYCVKYDDSAAASIAVDYLAGKGHEQIAFAYSWTDFQTVKDRQAGYIATLNRLGLPARSNFHSPLSTMRCEAAEAILKLMKSRIAPTALLAENEIMALVCMNTLIQAGFKIPQDIALIAIGDTLADHFSPIPLTTVSLRHDLMCHKAVETLHNMIENPKAAKQPAVQEIIKPELIIRASA